MACHAETGLFPHLILGKPIGVKAMFWIHSQKCWSQKGASEELFWKNKDTKGSVLRAKKYNKNKATLSQIYHHCTWEDKVTQDEESPVEEASLSLLFQTDHGTF